MPKPTQKYDPEGLQRLLRDLRTDFDGLRQRERPIKIGLIHRGINAEAEGVTGYPSRIGESSVAFLGAGHREERQNFDPDGKPRFIDPPVVDGHGKPIIDSETGKGIDFTMPASRSVELAGDIDAVARLRSLAERGGRLAVACRDRTLRLLTGWRFGSPEELWWALVFELAWSGRHPLLSATRHLWQTPEKGGLVRLPYDLVQLRQLATFPLGGMGKLVPKRWLKRLPDAYVSEVGDAASACSDLAAVLGNELEAALSGGNADAGPGENAHELAGQAGEPDVTGYVAHPSDPSAYVSAGDIVGRHTPAEMPLTAKQLTQVLEDYATNLIRWTRPAGKDGKPRPNRRNVHLTDWLAYVERQRAAGVAADEADWPVVSHDETAERTSAIRQQKSAGK